ncbi:MAG TPA: protein kinase [Longimicrobiales bacterium]|nr:protein kinase [Longimicrobiales bacterium]
MTDLSSRLNAALADRYRIERELGEGGMATVYLAEDLRHERKVALKVLKPELAAVVGGERFLAEIKTTANLQHPNILPLFDSGEAGGFLFFAMPHIEGETLRHRLDRAKQLPLDEAVRIASEVADALQVAHAQGVVHRDIKPANILLSHGRPLVADFGIALAVSAAGGGRLTETGLSVGTPYYMSPEQASADREPSAASDVYSLGCVLYEMLVGEPPFTGATAQAVLAKILTAEAPAPTAGRPAIPLHVDAVVRRALERLPADRFANAEDFARALADPGFRHGDDGASPGATTPGPWKAATFVAAAVAVVALGVASRSLLSPPPPGEVARFGSLFRPAQEMEVGADFTLSPDGSTLVYVGPPEGPGSGFRLWVRRLAELDATPIPGTEGFRGLDPSVSPDGTEVTFGGPSRRGVTVVRLDGGPVRMLLPDYLNPHWAEDGYIYASGIRDGITRVPATGGPAERISGPIPGVSIQRVTDVLPGARSALLTLSSGSEPALVLEIAVLDLTTGEARRLIPGSEAVYVPPGYLVFITAEGDLAGARFDARAGALDGPVVPLVAGVNDFALSSSGTLVYDAAPPPNHEFVWVDRSGVLSAAIPGWSVSGLTPRGFELSPDGTRLALTLTGEAPGIQDVWVKELPDGSAQRVSSGDRQAWGPRWMPSGDRLTYSSGVTGGRAMVSRRATGTGPVDTLVGPTLDAPDARLGPDGEWVVLRAGRAGGRTRFIATARLGPDGEPPKLILGEDYTAEQPDLSPDGRWLAYTSDETGRDEVYLRPFPDVGADRIVVSTDGGLQPHWSRDGREIFYVSFSGEMVAAGFQAEPDARITTRERLFTLPDGILGFNMGFATNYDVAEDGRFLLAREVEDPELDAPGLVLVQNWVTELEAALNR